jgi:hypothetical protein
MASMISGILNILIWLLTPIPADQWKPWEKYWIKSDIDTCKYEVQ